MKTKPKFGPRFNTRTYPWEAWFARSAFDKITLRQGRDFSPLCMPSSLGVMLRARVLRLGLRRTIRVGPDRVVIGPPDPKFFNRGPKRRRRETAQAD